MDGSSLSGVAGQGAGTKVRPVTSLPYTQYGLTLLSVTGNGSVMISYQNETLALRNRESRVNVTRRVENRTPGISAGPCTAEIITTDTIYNAGILENTRIICLP